MPDRGHAQVNFLKFFLFPFFSQVQEQGQTKPQGPSKGATKPQTGGSKQAPGPEGARRKRSAQGAKPGENRLALNSKPSRGWVSQRQAVKWTQKISGCVLLPTKKNQKKIITNSPKKQKAHTLRRFYFDCMPPNVWLGLEPLKKKNQKASPQQRILKKGSRSVGHGGNPLASMTRRKKNQK